MSTTMDELNLLKSELAEKESERRPLTELEQRWINLFARMHAQSRENCCRGFELIENEVRPILTKYLPDYDADDYR